MSLASFENERAELHPLLREYARLRAAEHLPALQNWELRHADYFGKTLGGEYIRAIAEDRDRTAAILIIDAERDNVTLAQNRALADGFPDAHLAVDLTDDLRQYWRLRDEPALLDWLIRALTLAEANNFTHLQANVLKAIGDVQAFRKDNVAALDSYAKAKALFEKVGAQLGQANINLAMGKLSNEEKYFQTAIDMHSAISSHYDVAVDKYYFGISRLQQNDERGIQLLQEARQGFEQSGFEFGVQAVDKILNSIQAEGDSSEP